MGIKFISVIVVLLMFVSCDKPVDHSIVEYYAECDTSNFDFKFINSNGEWELRHVFHHSVVSYPIKMLPGQKVGLEVISKDTIHKIHGGILVNGDSVNNYIFEEVKYSVVGDSISTDSVITYVSILSVL